MSAGGGGSERGPLAEINVTPLVDVMLVLLIIFMVTAPLLVTGVPVKLPTNDKPLVISLTAGGETFINETQVSAEELHERIADIAAAHAGDEPPQIFLRADARLDYGRVMLVMGALNGAGLNRIALVSTAVTDQPVSPRSE
jgi:biopolymer transport protein TolR